MVKLDIKYHTQRNNINFKKKMFANPSKYPSRTCFPTCLNMMLMYLLGYSYTDENIITMFERKWFRRMFKEEHGRIQWMMSYYYKYTLRYLWRAEQLLGNHLINMFSRKEKLVYKSFNTFLEMIQAITQSIENGFPVIVGMQKRITGRKFGHIILIVGYCEDCFIAHDPYGNWNTNYKDHDGSYNEYNFKDMTWALHKDRSLFLNKE